MHFLPSEVWWLAAGGASYGTRYLTSRLARHFAVKPPDETDKLLRSQAQFGYNAHALVSIGKDARAFWPDRGHGGIVFREVGNVWLAGSDPLTPPDESAECLRQFFDFAKRRGRIAAVIPATARLAASVNGLDLTRARIGSAPYFALADWDPRGDRAKGLRAGVNRARRGGVWVRVVDQVDPWFKQELQVLCRQWSGAHRLRTELGWLIALDPLRHCHQKRFFAARDSNDRLVGLLAASPIPARDGWYLEDVLRSTEAPACTADLLVYSALKALQEEGASLATLGTVPFHLLSADKFALPGSPRIEAGVEQLGARIARIYNIEGLRHFKTKFVPDWWESEYLLCSKGFAVTPRVARAVVRALVPRGVTNMLTREVTHVVGRRIFSLR